MMIGDDIKNIFVNENIINENESEGEITKKLKIINLILKIWI